MARGVNYIPDLNRFNLAGPPDWFLDQLWAFDDSLVIVPSRQEYLYRLAQRRKLNLAENIVNEAMKAQADTAMLVSYSLIPVTTIVATVNWSHPYLFEELRRRAPWRMGGADRVINDLEARERQEELQKRVNTDERNEYLSRDAWRFYQQKIGTRSHLYSPKTPDRRPVHPGLRRVSNTRVYRPDVHAGYQK